MIATKLQELIQKQRTYSAREVDIINGVTHVLEGRASPGDSTVDEVRGILRKLFSRPHQLGQPTYRSSSKLLNLKDTPKCLCGAAGTSPGIQLIQCVGCRNKFHR